MEKKVRNRSGESLQTGLITRVRSPDRRSALRFLIHPEASVIPPLGMHAGTDCLLQIPSDCESSHATRRKPEAGPSPPASHSFFDTESWFTKVSSDRTKSMRPTAGTQMKSISF